MAIWARVCSTAVGRRRVFNTAKTHTCQSVAAFAAMRNACIGRTRSALRRWCLVENITAPPVKPSLPSCTALVCHQPPCTAVCGSCLLALGARRNRLHKNCTLGLPQNRSVKSDKRTDHTELPGVADDEAGFSLIDHPGRREATRSHFGRHSTFSSIRPSRSSCMMASAIGGTISKLLIEIQWDAWQRWDALTH
jgi:hypothetical protein